MDLIIVESPSKAKTISKYLKGKYRVDSLGGTYPRFASAYAGRGHQEQL